jgi:hypothetical protein
VGAVASLRAPCAAYRKVRGSAFAKATADAGGTPPTAT